MPARRHVIVPVGRGAVPPGLNPSLWPAELDFTATVRVGGDTARIGLAFGTGVGGPRRSLHALPLFSQGAELSYRLGDVLGFRVLECRLLRRAESSSFGGPCAPPGDTGRALSMEIRLPVLRTAGRR